MKRFARLIVVLVVILLIGLGIAAGFATADNGRAAAFTVLGTLIVMVFVSTPPMARMLITSSEE